MKWTSDQQSQALQEGWGLFTVIDVLSQGRCGPAQLRILDSAKGVPGTAPQQVMTYVTKPTPEVVVGEFSGAVRHLLAQPEGARHMQQARSLHEGSLARYAARHATADDIARLAAVLEKNRLAIGDPQAFTRTDVEFHLVLAEIARNPVLVSLQVALGEWLAEQRSTSLEAEGADEAAWQAHEAIYRAVAAHDPDAAERAMETHLGEVGAYYWHVRGDAAQGGK